MERTNVFTGIAGIAFGVLAAVIVVASSGPARPGSATGLPAGEISDALVQLTAVTAELRDAVAALRPGAAVLQPRGAVPPRRQADEPESEAATLDDIRVLVERLETAAVQMGRHAANSAGSGAMLADLGSQYRALPGPNVAAVRALAVELDEHEERVERRMLFRPLSHVLRELGPPTHVQVSQSGAVLLQYTVNGAGGVGAEEGYQLRISAIDGFVYQIY